jgi:hypothetical protein
LAQHRASFAADKAESDDKVVWDDAEEEEDAGSQAVVESSSATHGNEGSDELVDSYEGSDRATHEMVRAQIEVMYNQILPVMSRGR